MSKQAHPFPASIEDHRICGWKSLVYTSHRECAEEIIDAALRRYVAVSGTCSGTCVEIMPSIGQYTLTTPLGAVILLLDSRSEGAQFFTWTIFVSLPMMPPPFGVDRQSEDYPQ